MRRVPHWMHPQKAGESAALGVPAPRRVASLTCTKFPNIVASSFSAGLPVCGAPLPESGSSPLLLPDYMDCFDAIRRGGEAGSWLNRDRSSRAEQRGRSEVGGAVAS